MCGGSVSFLSMLYVVWSLIAVRGLYQESRVTRLAC